MHTHTHVESPLSAPLVFIPLFPIFLFSLPLCLCFSLSYTQHVHTHIKSPLSAPSSLYPSRFYPSLSHSSLLCLCPCLSLSLSLSLTHNMHTHTHTHIESPLSALSSLYPSRFYSSLSHSSLFSLFLSLSLSLVLFMFWLFLYSFPIHSYRRRDKNSLSQRVKDR